MSTQPIDKMDRGTVDENLDALSRFVVEGIQAGAEAHLVTVMFGRLPEHAPRRMTVMTAAIYGLYSTLVTRVERRPASASSHGRLPILIAAPEKTETLAGSANGGWHVHGVLLVPPGSRLRVPADQHFRDDARLYVRPPIARIDLRAITETPENAVDYALKGLKRGRNFDDVLVLPRARSELVVGVTRRPRR